jgi:hypothetical protein
LWREIRSIVGNRLVWTNWAVLDEGWRERRAKATFPDNGICLPDDRPRALGIHIGRVFDARRKVALIGFERGRKFVCCYAEHRPRYPRARSNNQLQLDLAFKPANSINLPPKLPPEQSRRASTHRRVWRAA